MKIDIIKWLIDKVMGVADKFIPDAKERLKFRENILIIVSELESKFYDVIVKLQGQSSGSKLIDGFKHTVRPIIALAVLLQWILARHGLTPEFTQNEMYLLYGVFAFYFASRGFEKILKKT